MSEQPLRLKAMREEKKIKQKELAELMKVTLRQYQRYERGEQGSRLSGWVFLADFYDVSLDYLVGCSQRRERL